MVQLIRLLHAIYEFIHNFWEILHSVWFMVQGVFRFVARMIIAIPIFLASLPDWVIPICMCSFACGLACFVLGRK